MKILKQRNPTYRSHFNKTRFRSRELCFARPFYDPSDTIQQKKIKDKEYRHRQLDAIENMDSQETPGPRAILFPLDPRVPYVGEYIHH